MKFVAAALGGAALAVLVVAILFRTNTLVPEHTHPDKRDLQAEIAYEWVGKLDGRATEIENRLTAVMSTLANDDLTAKPDDRGEIGRWWCDIECARDRDECTLKAAEASKKTTCKRRRVAFCGSGRCFSDHGMCFLMGDTKRDCVGVE